MIFYNKMLNNQIIKIKYRPGKNQHQRNNKRYLVKTLPEQMQQNSSDRIGYSTEFTKQPPKRIRYYANHDGFQQQYNNSIHDLFVHPTQDVNYSLILSKPKEHVYTSNIIKLPKKFLKIKAQNLNRLAQFIIRPCRKKYNFTQQFSREIPSLTQVQKLSQRKQKSQKIPKIKLKKYKKISAWNNDYDIQKEFGFPPKQQQMPNNNFLRGKHAKLIQSKVIQIMNGPDLLQQLKQNQNQKNQQIEPKKQVLSQLYKQQQKQKNESESMKMQSLNPLKIKNSYLKLQFKDYNTTLLIKVNQQQSLLPTNKNILPNQQQVYQFIKYYKPFSSQINIKTLLMSPIFQVKLKNSSKCQQNNCNKNKNNNMLYFGQMKSNKYEGFGVLIQDNQIRQGVWQDGFLKKGIYKNENQLYCGQFKSGLKHGYGENVYINGSVYQGKWKYGQKNGSGYFKFSQKQIYVGGWKQDKFSGKGVFKTQQSIYQGDFKKSLKDGYGTEVFKNGQTFEGEFKQNVPQGKGIYQWKSGIKYEGYFYKGARHGKGVLFVPGVIQYEGNFKNDMPSGIGKAIYNNGDQYYGLFYQGERSGRGDLINRNNKKFITADWASDKLVHEMP